MPNLVVRVGADRFHMEPCRINDSFRPHEIRTEHFIGRVLVRILDAPGARILPSPSGEGTMEEPGREYFHDRSRKFCIQIEGKFTKPWRGDEVLFGTDFDRWIDFPRAPFAAGMRVAKMIDPCTFFDEHPASGRPYIMVPYVACMNTLCAWPAPARAHDAVVVLRHNSPASGATSGAASGSGSGLGAAGAGGGGGGTAQQHKSSTASSSPASFSPAPLADGSGSGAAELSGTTAESRLEGAERDGQEEETAEEDEEEAEEDEGDIVPVEALARTGTASPLPLTGPSHSHSHSSTTPPASSSTPTSAPTAKRTGWFSAWAAGGSSAAQQQKEKEKEERIVKSYWRFVGFKQDPRVRAFLEAHHASLEKMARQPSRNRSRSRPNTPRTAAGSSGAHANAGSGSGSANANATRTNSANSSPTLLERALSPSTSPAIGGNLPLSASPAPINASPGPNAHADPNAAAGAAGTAGTVATGAAIQMPLLHRLGTGLREQGQGGKTPEPFGDGALSPTLLADAQLAMDGDGHGNGNAGAEDAKATDAPSPRAVPHTEARAKENGASSAEAHGHAAHSHKGAEHKKEKKEKRTSMLTNPLKVFKPKAALHALNLGGKDEESNEDLARTASPTSTPTAGVSANANASAAMPAQNEPAHTGRLGHGFGLGFGLKKNKSVSSGHSQSTTTASSQPHTPASPKKEPELLPSPVTQPQPKQQPATPVPQDVESPAPTTAPAPTSTPAQPQLQPQPAPAAQPAPEQPSQPVQPPQQPPSQQDDLPVMPELARITTSVRKEMEKSAQGDGLTEEDFKLADRLHHTHVASPPPPPAAHLPAVAGSGNGNGAASTEQDAAQADAGEWHSTLDDELGPWRFSDPGTDMIEDNAFIFTHESVSVPKRRKYFADAKHRSDFVYDPDVVYGASFFTDMASLTTMNLHLGPVKLNIARFFKDMPIRYTLRAADENITFCTISFQLE